MSQKKKILIFIDWFLPAYKAGGPIRSVANLVDALHKRFDFYIITSNKDYLEKEPYKDVISDNWTDYDSKAKVIYVSDKQLNKSNFLRLIEEIDFEIAYINGVYSYYFSILPLRLLKNNQKKVIVAPRGMLSKQAFSAKSFKKIAFIKIAKIAGLYKNVCFHATLEKEATDIKNIISNSADIKVVPNLTRQIEKGQLVKRSKDKGKLRLASIARISVEKNTLFALQVLTNLDYKGIIEYDLYGSIYNENYWDSCKKIIEQLPENIKVNYKLSVESNKVYDTFSVYHFAFMPSKGENFGHSMYEALSAGCPLIISNQTPWKSLEEKNIGWDLDLNDINKYQDVIIKCADLNQEDYDQLSENAFKFACDYTKMNDHINSTIKLFE